MRDYLVVDLEATSDERGRHPREEMETIEIGAVLIDGALLMKSGALESRGEFQCFIRPIRHPVLSEFCRQLTSIRQEDVDQAMCFPEAIDALHAFLKAHREPDQAPALFCSWGAYDRRQLTQDAALHRCALPLGEEYLNLKTLFSERLRLRRRFGMACALKRVGLTLQGVHHRGIDDARNIARLLPFIVGPALLPSRRGSPSEIS